MMKPLFIPLKTEYFNAFEDGSKTTELRAYGPRWNENTCAIGREVILSKGYGKHQRMKGRVCRFTRQHAALCDSSDRAAIMDVFGTLEIEVACIGISQLEPI